ncbi:hypothetical protein LPJGGPFB_04832 [Ensifer adhaerens]|nr:hypothetical protein [Ensifer adhaerens]
MRAMSSILRGRRVTEARNVLRPFSQGHPQTLPMVTNTLARLAAAKLPPSACPEAHLHDCVVEIVSISATFTGTPDDKGISSDDYSHVIKRGKNNDDDQ